MTSSNLAWLRIASICRSTSAYAAARGRRIGSEEQLDPSRSSQIEVPSNDLFEQLPPLDRLGEDPAPPYFHLPDGEPISRSSYPASRSTRVGGKERRRSQVAKNA